MKLRNTYLGKLDPPSRCGVTSLPELRRIEVLNTVLQAPTSFLIQILTTLESYQKPCVRTFPQSDSVDTGAGLSITMSRWLLNASWLYPIKVLGTAS